MEGWIRFHRKFIKWGWFKKPYMFHLFGYLLMMACHEDIVWQGVKIKRGQLITGRNSISANTGISAQCVRTCIKRLKSTNEITIKSTKQYSIITITNYDYYNPIEKKSTNESANDLTNDQPTINQRSTIYNNVNNVKNTFFKENYIKESKTENFNQKLLNTPINEII